MPLIVVNTIALAGEVLVLVVAVLVVVNPLTTLLRRYARLRLVRTQMQGILIGQTVVIRLFETTNKCLSQHVWSLTVCDMPISFTALLFPIEIVTATTGMIDTT